MAIKVVEVCQVSPAQGAAQEQLLLPLVNFDIVRLGNNLLNFLFFYTLQCSESDFINTIVPGLKNSLSLTLKHFLPLSGKIVFPLSTSGGMPVCRYVSGEDAVSLTVAVSDADFNHLAGIHDPREADEFHDFVPQTLSPTSCSDSIRFSGLAVQLTLFPNQGICIGQTIHHAIADGTTILAFQQAWASIHKFNGDDAQVLPFYERSSSYSNHLAAAWAHKKTSRPRVSSSISFPTNAVRAKLILSEAEIRKLINFAKTKKPAIPYISSTVVVSGLVWSCYAKSAEEGVADDELEYLTCSANCRARMSPPLPDTYFGNCVVLVQAESTHGALKGKGKDEGFVAASHAIGEALHNFFNKIHANNNNTFDDLEIRIKLDGKRVTTVAGSPRYDYYSIDYGWGRPKGFEYLTNDCDGSIFLCKPKGGGGGGGIEIGLSMPKVRMEAFAAFFHQLLSQATHMINSNL